MNIKVNEVNDKRIFLLMTLILSHNQLHKLAQVAERNGLIRGLTMLCRGTVRNTTLNWLGIKSEKMIIVNILVEKEKASEVMDSFSEELQMHKQGHGIIYTTPIATGKQILNNGDEALDILKNTEEYSMFKKLTVIVNRGLAEDVIEIARRAGANGGTVIHGRGTGSEYAEKLLGMEIEPEKEIIMILMPSELIDKVVKGLYEGLQFDNPNKGILFVEPVLDVRGLFENLK